MNNNKDIFSDEEKVEEHNNSKQKWHQTRYGRDIPDYSEQESDQEYEKYAILICHINP